MKILNPEIESHLNSLPKDDAKQSALLKRLLVFENDNADKSNYAFKQQIIDMLDEILKENDD